MNSHSSDELILFPHPHKSIGWLLSGIPIVLQLSENKTSELFFFFLNP